MSDQQLTCIDCGATFEFSEGEQQFYSDRGLTPPKRCKDCRAKKKARQQSGGARQPRVHHDHGSDSRMNVGVDDGVDLP